MADEPFNLPVRVVDQFSSPLAKLRNEIGAVAKTDSAKQIQAQWRGFQTTLGGVTREIRTGVSPALNSLGLGFVGLGLGGAAVAGLATSFKSFAGNVRQMSLLGREIGLTTDRLRAWSAFGEQFGVSTEQMSSSLKSFYDNMGGIKDRWSEAYSSLRAMNLGNLVEDLVKAPTMDAALTKVFESLASIPDSRKRRRVLQLLGLPEDFSAVADEIHGKVKSTVDAIQADLGPVSKQTEEAADRFEKNWARMGRALDNFKNESLGPLLPEVTKALEGLTDITSAIGKGDWKTALKAFQFGGLSPEDQAKAEAEYRNSWAGKVRGRAGADVETGDIVQALEQAKRSKRGLEDILGLHESRGDDAKAVETRRRIEKLADEIKRLSDELARAREGKPTVQQQSYSGGGGGDGGARIQTASFGGFGGFGGGGGIGVSPFPNGGGGEAAGSPSHETYGGKRRARTHLPSIRLGAVRQPAAALGDGDVSDMLGLIAKAEGTTKLGYNDSFAHQLKNVDLMSMSVAEIQTLQRRMSGSSAIGKYQMMRGTLRDALSAGVVSPDDKFNAETQDKLARWRIEFRRARAARGGFTMDKFQNELAKEWASFPTTAGVGYYPGQRASVPGSAVRSAAQAYLDGSTATAGGNPFGGRARRAADADYPFGNDMRFRRGDAMMQRSARAFGGLAVPPTTKLDASGTVNVHLSGGLEKLPARISMDGLFKDARISREKQMPDGVDI